MPFKTDSLLNCKNKLCLINNVYKFYSSFYGEWGVTKIIYVALWFLELLNLEAKFLI